MFPIDLIWDSEVLNQMLLLNGFHCYWNVPWMDQSIELPHTLCEWVFCLHVCVYHVCAWCPWRPEKDIKTGVRDSCESRLGIWKANLCLLQEQLVFLTTETSLHPFKVYLNCAQNGYRMLSLDYPGDGRQLLNKMPEKLSLKNQYLVLCI